MPTRWCCDEGRILIYFYNFSFSSGYQTKTHLRLQIASMLVGVMIARCGMEEARIGVYTKLLYRVVDIRRRSGNSGDF